MADYFNLPSSVQRYDLEDIFSLESIIKNTSGIKTDTITITNTSPYSINTVDNSITNTFWTNGSSLSNIESIDKIQKSFKINFGHDLDDCLKNNFVKIKNKKMFFDCCSINNRLQPYEFIMDLIDLEYKFDIIIDIEDFLKIKYENFRFLKIKNNFSFKNDLCSFSTICVKFKYDSIYYENKRLDLKQKRFDKLKKLDI